MTLAHFPNICEIQLTVLPVLLEKPSLSVFCRDMAPLWFCVCKFHRDQIPLTVIGLSSFRDWENITFCQWAVYKATLFSLALNIEILHFSGVALTTFYAQIGQGPGKINGFYPRSQDNQSCNYNFPTPQLYIQLAGLQLCTKDRQRTQMGF